MTEVAAGHPSSPARSRPLARPRPLHDDLPACLAETRVGRQHAHTMTHAAKAGYRRLQAEVCSSLQTLTLALTGMYPLYASTVHGKFLARWVAIDFGFRNMVCYISTR